MLQKEMNRLDINKGLANNRDGLVLNNFSRPHVFASAEVSNDDQSLKNSYNQAPFSDEVNRNDLNTFQKYGENDGRSPSPPNQNQNLINYIKEDEFAQKVQKLDEINLNMNLTNFTFDEKQNETLPHNNTKD